MFDDNVDISCQYQRTTTSGLICRAANTRGNNTNDRPTPEVCASCNIGKVERELGCTHIGGELFIVKASDGTSTTEPDLWCRLRKRETDYQYCKQCSYIESHATTQLVTNTIDILDAAGFSSAKEAIIDARKQLQEMDFDGCIRSSTVALESACKIILDLNGKAYPSEETVTHLWKAAKPELDMTTKEQVLVLQLLNSLRGVVQNLAGIRNDLADVHGKGLIPPEVFKSYAELALNTSATLITFIVRRSQEGKSNG